MMYYDREGKPMSSADWMRAFEDVDGRVIAKTPVPGGEVSTVWLGLDHRMGDGPPLIFESMVFGGPFDDETRRYATEQEARDGHRALVMQAQG